MKLICPYTAISYKTSIGYGHGKVPHPIFGLPTGELVSQNLDPFIVGSLSGEEIHLLGCALLAKLPVIWDVALDMDICIPKWKAHIERLAATVLRYVDKGASNAKGHDLPEYRICIATENLANLNVYLSAVNEAISGQQPWGTVDPLDPDTGSSYLRDEAEEMILKLLRTVSNRASATKELPALMADWAADVGDFPDTSIKLLEGKTSTLKAHWKFIIKRLFESKSPVEILSDHVTVGDIAELIEQCESHIDIGSIHSLALFKKLRQAQSILDEFSSPARLADIKVVAAAKSGNLADLLGGSPEGANKPAREYQEGEPRKEDFTNFQAYMQARIRWSKILKARNEKDARQIEATAASDALQFAKATQQATQAGEL